MFKIILWDNDKNLYGPIIFYIYLWQKYCILAYNLLVVT